jgi:diaminopimelate epimerase
MNNYLNFSKMQALGNDFMVINHQNPSFSAQNLPITLWSNRHFGIGFDQLLAISPCMDNTIEFKYQIFNPDGSEVGQCGNGARCAAVYIHKYLRPHQTQFKLNTSTTSMDLEIIGDNLVKLSLPPPVFDPKHIPIKGFEQARAYSLTLDSGHAISLHALQVGNPHAVILIEDLQQLQTMNIQELGHAIEHHSAVPERCNVNFMHIQNTHHIHLRVWERGCGETLACGSGALASAVVAKTFYHAQGPIQVKLPGGELSIDWDEKTESLQQIGPAFEVYRGTIAFP